MGWISLPLPFLGSGLGTCQLHLWPYCSGYCSVLWTFFVHLIRLLASPRLPAACCFQEPGLQRLWGAWTIAAGLATAFSHLAMVERASAALPSQGTAAWQSRSPLETRLLDSIPASSSRSSPVVFLHLLGLLSEASIPCLPALHRRQHQRRKFSRHQLW